MGHPLYGCNGWSIPNNIGQCLQATLSIIEQYMNIPKNMKIITGGSENRQKDIEECWTILGSSKQYWAFLYDIGQYCLVLFNI